MLVVLTQDISLEDTNNQPVTFRKGTFVYVDMGTLIAFADNLHFTIERFEFDILQ